MLLSSILMSPPSSKIPQPSTLRCARCSRPAQNVSEGALPNKRWKLAASKESVLIHAVLFDLYETLVTEVGAPVTRAGSLAKILGVEESRYKPHWKSRRPDIIVGRKSFIDVMTEIASVLGGSTNLEVLKQVRAERLSEKAAVLRNVEGQVLKAISDLRRRRLKLAVISNTFPEDVAGWDVSPLRPFFDAAIFSCDVKLAKPDPRIYLLACQRLNVSPECALFIGDGIEEVVGARAAGLTARRALWFASKPSAAAGAPDDQVLWRPTEVVDAVLAA